MNAGFIFFIIFAVLWAPCALVGLLTVRHATDDDSDGQLAFWWSAGIGTVFFAGLCLSLVFASFSPVGARETGVVQSFGRTTGHVGPGINWVSPWETVTPIDESYQITDQTFTVRIAGGQTAQAIVKVRWNSNSAKADDIFQNYKTTNGLENGLLIPELNVATNTVLEGYDPLTPLATGAKAGTAENPSTAQMGAAIKALLISKVSPDINVKTLALHPLVYDPTVQDRINSVTNQVAKTDVAQQSEKTAGAQARANEIIQGSLKDNPLALVQQCVNGLADGQIQNMPGFSCWPGSGSSVVIPAAGK